MPSTRKNLGAVAAVAAALLPAAVNAVNPIEVSEQDFTVSGESGKRFTILGIDYQPGGSSGFNPASGVDPLSNPNQCLRDAALMQQLGVNTIRSYNVDPAINHDLCASIFNSVGIYMIIDVNSPLPGGSIDNEDPSSTYDSTYLKRVFQVVDSFREYPNTLGFFSANELINSDATAKANPPYIRAVTRDIKDYMSARGGRQVPVGYSAADVDDVLIDTANYVSCDNGDNSNSDFFGLNDYEWCGPQATYESSGYNVLEEQFSNFTIPIFFSEYGCNKVLPRTFPEVPTLYSEQMSAFSGGLVYQWTQDVNNFGLVVIDSPDQITLRSDYNALAQRYAGLDYSYLESLNTTAAQLDVPKCSSSLITGNVFGGTFDLPSQPPGTSDLINNGAGGRVGQIVEFSQTHYSGTIINGSQVINGISITKTSVADTAGSQGTTTSSAAIAGPIPSFHLAGVVPFALITPLTALIWALL